ncbi:MAG: HPP family protein [Acidimicrobiia bacterium]|nr:HPP family protein [Acidimicrobiia bacterium]
MTEPEFKRDSTGPIGGQMNAIVFGLASRMQIPYLVKRHSSTTVMGLFAFANGVLSIGIMSMAALLTGSPFVFPSLGPTAFLFFYTPTNPAASPRNAILGHGIGAGAGYLSLVIFGLTDAAPALATEVTLARVGAAALSLGLTSGLMVWFRVPHPPAGATTLIVSLGILTTPRDLAVLMLAVVLLTVQGFVINRTAGIDYPRWAPKG